VPALTAALNNVMVAKATFDAVFAAAGGLPTPTVVEAANNHTAAVAAVPAGTYCAAANVLSLTGVSCAHLLDLAAYLNYVAQKLVWEPNFVRRPVSVYNAGSGTFGAHPDPVYAAIAAAEGPAPMRSRPFIKCTVGELLETGIHDNFVDYASSLLLGATPGSAATRTPPAAPAHYPADAGGDAAWAAASAAMLPDTTYTGAHDISLVDVVTADRGDSVITTWGGEVGSSTVETPVAGSYSGTQYAPALDVFVDYNAPPPTQSVWLYQARVSRSTPRATTVAAGSAVQCCRYCCCYCCRRRFRPSC
jgi:hypothetical protein